MSRKVLAQTKVRIGGYDYINNMFGVRYESAKPFNPWCW